MSRGRSSRAVSVPVAVLAALIAIPVTARAAAPASPAARPAVASAATTSPAPAGSRELEVMVFAGHTRGAVGGNSRGATSHSGVIENELNDRVVDLFSRYPRTTGIDYVVLKAEDNIDLKTRPAIAGRNHRDVLLEIHHDAGQPADIQAKRFAEMEGFSIFYSARNPEAARSRLLCELIGDRLLRRGFKPNHYHAKDIDGERRHEVDRGRAIYERDLYVNAHSRVASVLLECGCIVCPREEQVLLKESTRAAIVQAVHEALLEYRKSIPAGR